MCGRREKGGKERGVRKGGRKGRKEEGRARKEARDGGRKGGKERRTETGRQRGRKG